MPLRYLVFCGLIATPTQYYNREAIFSDVWLKSSITHWTGITACWSSRTMWCQNCQEELILLFHQRESLLKPTSVKNKSEQRNDMTISQLWKFTRFEIGSWYNFHEKKLERSGKCQSHGMGNIESSERTIQMWLQFRFIFQKVVQLYKYISVECALVLLSRPQASTGMVDINSVVEEYPSGWKTVVLWTNPTGRRDCVT